MSEKRYIYIYIIGVIKGNKIKTSRGPSLYAVNFRQDAAEGLPEDVAEEAQEGNRVSGLGV